MKTTLNLCVANLKLCLAQCRLFASRTFIAIIASLLCTTAFGQTSMPASGLFGTVGIGSTPSITFTITNNNALAVGLTHNLSGDSEFGFNASQGANPCVALMMLPGMGGTCTFVMDFLPATVGSHSGTLSVSFDELLAITIPLSGVAFVPAPIVSITGSTSFPNTNLGTSSGVQAITITNTGTDTLILNGIAHNNPAVFPDTTSGPSPNSAHYCGFGSSAGGAPVGGSPKFIAVGASCVLNLIFAPGSSGALMGSITINSNAASSPNTIALGGTGTFVSPTLSISSAPFGAVLLSTVADVPVTLTGGSGASALTFSSNNADFTIVNNMCGVSIVAGGMCNFAIRFAPSVLGAAAGVVTVGSMAGSIGTINVTGTGVGPTYLLAPASIAYGNVAIGVATPVTVTFTNTSSVTNTISGAITSSNAMYVATPSGVAPCSPGVVVAAMGQCTFTSTFTPTSPGSTTTSYSFSYTVGGLMTPILSRLMGAAGTGVNVAPVITSAAPPAGTVGVAYTYNATATGTPTITWNVSLGSLPSGLSINPTTGVITGTPLTAGTTNFTLQAANGTAPNSTLATSITISAAPAPVFVPSAISFSFGSLLVTTTSTSQTLTITNTGNANLIFSGSFVVTGDFARGATTCSSITPVIPTGSCFITLTFTPTTAGALSGSLGLTHNALGSPTNITLSGTGTPITPPALVIETPTTVVAGANYSLALRLFNYPGNPALSGVSVTANYPSFTNQAASGGFPQPGCGSTISTYVTNASTSTASAGGIASVGMGSISCYMEVAKLTAPATPGVYNVTIPIGGFTIASTGFTNLAPITLSVTVTAAPTPAVTLNTNSLNFGSQSLGLTTPFQSVFLTNSGTGPLTINNIINSGDFGFLTTCPFSPATLPAITLNVCKLDITFTPTTTGTRTGIITITDDASGSPHLINLTGIGTLTSVPGVAFTPGGLNFTGQTVNTISAVQSLVLTNTGTATLSISGAVVTGNFALSNVVLSNGLPSCSNSLAAGASCTYGITFNPITIGNLSGQFTLTDSASGSPHTVNLSGVSNAIPQPSISVSGINFADQVSGTTSAAQSVAIANSAATQVGITNITAATLTITSITLNGIDFVLSGTCSTILPGATCTAVSVQFKPQTNGAKTGTITIASNSRLATGATSTTTVVILTGTGIPSPTAKLFLSSTAIGYANTLIGYSLSEQGSLTNIGGAPLTISAIVSPSAPFSISSSSCPLSPNSLGVNLRCVITILFSPGAANTSSSEVQINSNSASSPDRIQLGGTGCKPYSAGSSRLILAGC